MPTGIEKVVALFDNSPTKAVTALELGESVKRQHIEHWLKVGRVPPEHAPAIRAKSSVPLWELCPTVWHRVWPELVSADGAPPAPSEREAA